MVRQKPTITVVDLRKAKLDEMQADIDRLRAWKAEALQVLAEWDQCYDTLAAAGHPAPLGMSMARHVAGYLKIAVDAENPNCVCDYCSARPLGDT